MGLTSIALDESTSHWASYLLVANGYTCDPATLFRAYGVFLEKSRMSEKFAGVRDCVERGSWFLKNRLGMTGFAINTVVNSC